MTIRSPAPPPHRGPSGPTRARQGHVPRSAARAVMDFLSISPLVEFDRLRSATAALGVEADALIDEGLVAVHGEWARIADPALRLRHLGSLSADERARCSSVPQEHAGMYPATFLWHRSHAEPHRDRERLLAAAVDWRVRESPRPRSKTRERALAGRIGDATRSGLLVDLGEALVMQGHGVRLSTTSGVPGRQAIRGRAPGRRSRGCERRMPPTAPPTRYHAAHRGADRRPAPAERLLCEGARLHLSRGEIQHAHSLVVRAVERGVRLDRDDTARSHARGDRRRRPAARQRRHTASRRSSPSRRSR